MYMLYSGFLFKMACLPDESNSFLKRPYGFFSSKSSAILVIGTLVTVFPLALILWMVTALVSAVNADYSDSREGKNQHKNERCVP